MQLKSWFVGICALATITAAEPVGYTAQAINITGSTFAVMTDVNNQQLFVGYSQGAAPPYRGFVWDRIRARQVINPPPGFGGDSYLFAINNNRRVVGFTIASNRSTGYTYTIPSNGIVTGNSTSLLNTPFFETEPCEVNDNDVIVGRGGRTSNSTWRPYFAEPTGLGTWNHYQIKPLLGIEYFDRAGTAYAVNDNGLIGGVVNDASNTSSKPFVANAASKVNNGGETVIVPTFLPTGAYSHGCVRSINNAGWKVGYVWNGAAFTDGPAFFEVPTSCFIAVWNPSNVLTVYPSPLSSTRGALYRVNDFNRAVGFADLVGGSRGIDFLAETGVARNLMDVQPVLGYTGGRRIVGAYGINSLAGWTSIAALGLPDGPFDAVVLRQFDDSLNSGTRAIGSVSVTTPPQGGSVVNSFNYGVSYGDPTLGAGGDNSDYVGQSRTLNWASFYTSDSSPVTGTNTGQAILPQGASSVTVTLPLGWQIPLTRSGDTIRVDGQMDGYQVDSAFLSIESPVATLTSITPSSAYVGQSTVTVSASGANFWRNNTTGLGSRLVRNGTSLGLMTVSASTQASFPLSIALQTTPTTWQLAVSNDASAAPSASRAFQLLQSSTAIAPFSVSARRGQSAVLSALVRANNPGDNTRAVSGLTVTATYLGRVIGTAVTSSNSFANVSFTITPPMVPVAGENAVTLSVTGTAGYAASTVNAPLSVTNTPPVPTMSGGAMNFGPGAGSRLTVSSFGTFPTGDFTVEYWQRLGSPVNWVPFQYGSSVNNFSQVAHNVFGSDGVMQFSPQSSASSLSALLPPAERAAWHKVVATYSAAGGGRATLYVINAAGTVICEESVSPIARTTVTPADVIIGLCSSQVSDASLDELRIWSVAMSRNDILARLRQEPSLAAVGTNTDTWRMDTLRFSAGDTWVQSDRPMNLNEARLTSSPSWVASTAPLNRVTTIQSTPVTVQLRAWDPDLQTVTFRSKNSIPAVGGSVSVNQNSGLATFTPTPGFIGLGSFAYEVNDGTGWSSTSETVEVAVQTNPISLSGSITVNGSALGYAFPMTIEIWQNNTWISGATVTVNAGGSYSAQLFAAGTVTYRLRNPNSLRRTFNGTATNGAIVSANLLAGDADQDNEVTISDYIALSSAFGREVGMVGWDVRADFDFDGIISIIDYLMLSQCYGVGGQL
jgi:hypothetical protein